MFPERTGGIAAAPIKIGTRGTVGNLVMEEIRYFNNLDPEVVMVVSSKKHGGGAGYKNFALGFGYLKIAWRRMKRKGGSCDKFLLRVCMKVDVANHHHHRRHHAKEIPGFTYQNLEADAKQYKL